MHCSAYPYKLVTDLVSVLIKGSNSFEIRDYRRKICEATVTMAGSYESLELEDLFSDITPTDFWLTAKPFVVWSQNNLTEY